MDVQKFFNKKLRNPKSAYGLGKLFSKTKPYSSRIGRRVKETPTLKKFLSIHKKVRSIETLLGGIGKLDAKIIGVQDKAEKDKKKETKKGGKSNKFLGGILQRPKTGALDTIKNFVTYTFLGWLFTVLQPHIDKMQFILPVIQTTFDVLIFILKNILGGIGNTLKAFYFAKDTITGATDKVKQAASGIQKTFDDTLIALQDVVNGTIEVANFFIEATGEKFNKVETVDVRTIPPLPETPKFDNNAASFTTPSNTLPPGIPIKSAATGGRIDPSTPVTRGIQSEERQNYRPLFKPLIQEQKSEPGKDVGGVNKIKDLYKSSVSGGGFFNLFSTYQKDGFLTLNKVSKELKINKSNDFLGLGNLMGASVDVALGQKPDRRTYQQFASGVNYLVNYGINNPEAFQKMNLEQMIETMVNSKVDVAINKIREEINKTSTSETPDTNYPSGGGTAGGEYGGYAPSGIQKEIYEYLTNVKKLNDIQALGIMANIFRESGFRVDAKQPDGPGIGLFQYSSVGRKSAFIQAVPDWEKNWKAQIDYALREPGEPGPEYMRTNFKTPQEAADWWMRRWERPAEYIQNSKGPRKHKEYLATVPKAPDGTANFREPENAVIAGPGSITADKIYPLTAGQGRDVSKEPGIDFTYKGGKTLALYPGKVVDIGTQFNRTTGRGYGNYVLVESVDPNTGRKFTTLYAHFGDGKISVRRGDVIEAGAPIGAQPNANKRGYFTGSGSGEHTSADFYEPDGRTRYRGSNKLISQILDTFAGKPAYPVQQQQQLPQVQPPRPTLTPPSIINAGEMDRQQLFNTIKNIKPGQKVVFTGIGSVQGGRDWLGNPQTKYFDTQGNSLTEAEFTKKLRGRVKGNTPPKSFKVGGFTYEEKVVNGRKIYTENGKPIAEALYKAIEKNHIKPKQMKKGGLVYEQNHNPLLPPQTYASYNKPQMMAKIFIQPIIVETPSSSNSSMPLGIVFPSTNLNNTKSQSFIKN